MRKLKPGEIVSLYQWNSRTERMEFEAEAMVIGDGESTHRFQVRFSNGAVAERHVDPVGQLLDPVTFCNLINQEMSS